MACMNLNVKWSLESDSIHEDLDAWYLAALFLYYLLISHLFVQLPRTVPKYLDGDEAPELCPQILAPEIE